MAYIYQTNVGGEGTEKDTDEIRVCVETERERDRRSDQNKCVKDRLGWR